MNLPNPGALVEIFAGSQKFQTGIAIGAYESEWSGYPLLAVFLTETNRLAMTVLPEAVFVIYAHTDVLEGAPVMLAPEELRALMEIERMQLLKDAR